jgi:hypothetical protein
MTYSGISRAIEDLAQAIGDKVYLDIAKWHLYLQDAKLHVPLAEKIYPLIDEDRVSEDEVMSILNTMTVPIGGGKKNLPLIDLIPNNGVRTLMQAIEDYQRDT